MVLEPLSQFVLARGLENHLDLTTYYVRAVIRDGKTDTLIDTVNLTDRGDSHRFTKQWQVPPDPTGEGRDILIIYSVYTDSGYTTKAENYADEYVEHRIWHQQTHSGGGIDVDYKKIQKMINEAISNIPKPRPAKEVDLSPVSDSLQAILTEIRAIDIPTPEKVTFTPLVDRFDALEKAIKVVQNKEMPETDLDPVLDAISDVKTELASANLDRTHQAAEALYKRIQEFFASDLEKIDKSVKELSKQFNAHLFMAVKPPKDDKQAEVEPIDYESLLA